jgi:two-component system nitrogen regulation sensor histidine kinase NtrY
LKATRSGDNLRLSERGRKRLTTVVVLSIITLLLLLSLVAQSSFNLSPLVSPDTAGETLLLYALSTLNFLAFVTLLFVLLRQVLKLVRERRDGRLGSKFKARLVSFAIGIALLPVLLMFFFAFGLLNRSIDRWFGGPARQIVDDAKVIQENYFKKEEAELTRIARAMARSLPPSSRISTSDPTVLRQLRQEMADYDLALVRLISRGNRISVKSSDDVAEQEIEETLTAAERSLASGEEVFAGRDDGESPTIIYVIAAAKIAGSPDGVLILARQFPRELTQRAANISAQDSVFQNLRGKIKRIKAIYILLLAAVALLLIFAASWLALYVARGITVPIQALVEATDRMARGDFSQPVEVVADDELAVLVSSFNQMVAQLAENRERLERAAEDLRRTNVALDDRRRYIETVLDSLSTGVISTDAFTRVATINRAALAMLGLSGSSNHGTRIDRLIAGRQGEQVVALINRARRTGQAHAEVEYERADGSRLATSTTAIALKDSQGALAGYVIVIEDLTDLIQAERAAAWSEVARRMAHEIKNPLTPIQLSAERIMRNYKRNADPQSEARFDEIVREGTATIVREVSALQRMVEEFSRFARLPEARPVEASLNDVVRETVALYRERLGVIEIKCDLSPDLPRFCFDAEQMKQVLINLIDNAIEALTDGEQAQPVKLIKLESRYLKTSETVRLTVADTGHGIKVADRSKLFLPKFSTRERGTGLGLAIVSHIISDHKGRIWVEDNHPRGARFIIELPVGSNEPGPIR